MIKYHQKMKEVVDMTNQNNSKNISQSKKTSLNKTPSKINNSKKAKNMSLSPSDLEKTKAIKTISPQEKTKAIKKLSSLVNDSPNTSSSLNKKNISISSTSSNLSNENKNESLELTNSINLSKKSTPKKHKNIKLFLIISIIVILISCLTIFIVNQLSPKFQDVTIELGDDAPTLQAFLKKASYEDKAQLLTNLDELDYSQVNSYKIDLKYKKRPETVILNIVDTTAPTFEVQDVRKYIDYELNPDDFITSKDDKSPMTTEIINPPTIENFGTYEIEVAVSDSSHNQTIKKCNLVVTRIVKSFELELGTKLTKKDILLNYENDADYIKQSDINQINKKDVGTYQLDILGDDLKETATINIVDTKGPELKLKKVSIYKDETIKNKNVFISSVKDASDDVEITIATDINYSKVGKQEVTIEATDKYGNKTTATTTLTIKEDKEPPVFKNLTALTVNKRSTINYEKNVKAIDSKDGEVEFSVDSSKVDLTKSGTYYAKYTAKDNAGNKVTKSRTIIVRHDQEDTNQLFNEFYNNYLSDKSPGEMAIIISQKIRYSTNWGEDDPVYYGLTQKSGNCYVHAQILKKALDKKGIANKLIYTTNKSHYWNLVNVGVWRHFDATTGRKEVKNTSIALYGLNDDEKYSYLGGDDWNRDAFPAAN